MIAFGLLLVAIVPVLLAAPFPAFIVVRPIISFPCFGGIIGLSNTDITLTYGYRQDFVSDFTSLTISSQLTAERYDLSYSEGNGNTIRQVEYLFEQIEHGGGYCNCVEIEFDSMPPTYKIELCEGSASVARRKQVLWNNNNTGQLVAPPQIVPKLPALQLNCHATPYVKISFAVIFPDGHGSCDSIDEFNEGVEFSYQLSSMSNEWIPVTFIHNNMILSSTSLIPLGDPNNFSIRGYQVFRMFNDTINQVSLSLCGFISTDSIRFRWFQTSRYIAASLPKDTWILNNIKIDLVKTDHASLNILNENFSDLYLNSQIWPANHVRNGQVGQYCNYTEGLIFGLNVTGKSGEIIESRELLTQYYSFSTLFTSEVVNEITTLSPQAMDKFNALTDTEFLNTLETNTRDKILGSEELSNAFISSVLSIDSLSNLKNLTVSSSDLVDIVTLTYLYDNQVTAALNNISLSGSIVMEIVSIGIDILSAPIFVTSRALIAAGTTLLSLQEKFLAFTTNSQTYQSANFVLYSRVIDLNNLNSSTITAINSSDFKELIGPKIILTIPLELLKFFDDGDGSIRLISAIYRNLSHLFSYNLNESLYLGPDIVSSSIQCGRSICSTSNYTLQSSVVTITFEHSQDIKDQIKFNNLETQCVFLDIMESNSSIFKTGRWSSRGCSKSFRLSSTSVTVCECNHLTHFAILLSPKPPQFSNGVNLSLQIIGYVGMTISLIAMTITVATFTAIKSLYSFRNFIHINLCVSLGVTQLFYFVGVDQTGTPNSENVPVHCQVIAVLLHYGFLVSFMWMLMEGVFLYLALVKVFITNTKRYAVTFAAVSYGLPLLYMGVVTIPLGFGLPQRHYGYSRACFLNSDSHFTWAFIAPVIIIFIVNILLLVMGATIMWKQKRKRKFERKLKDNLKWLKAVISLTIVMGLTWIVGIFVIEREELVFLAYIFTFASAFQGAFIFLVLIVFTKPVRVEIRKWIFSKQHKIAKNKISNNSTTPSNQLYSKDKSEANLS